MAFDYVWEKFHVATITLASGSSPIQQRLTDAFTGSLIRLSERDFPTPRSKKRFAALLKSATRAKPAGDEGSIAATFNAMSDEECRTIAKEIVGFYDEVAQEQGFRSGEPVLE